MFYPNELFCTLILRRVPPARFWAPRSFGGTDGHALLEPQQLLRGSRLQHAEHDLFRRSRAADAAVAGAIAQFRGDLEQLGRRLLVVNRVLHVKGFEFVRHGSIITPMTLTEP